MLNRFPMILIALFVSLMTARATQAAPVVIDRLEASVNSGLVLLSDVRAFRATEKLRQQLDPLFSETPLAAKGEGASTSDIVDYLIDEKLIMQRYPVGDAEVHWLVNSLSAVAACAGSCPAACR